MTSIPLEMRVPGGIVMGRGTAKKMAVLVVEAINRSQRTPMLVFPRNQMRDSTVLRMQWRPDPRELRVLVPEALRLSTGQPSGWARELIDLMLTMAVPVRLDGPDYERTHP